MLLIRGSGGRLAIRFSLGGTTAYAGRNGGMHFVRSIGAHELVFPFCQAKAAAPAKPSSGGGKAKKKVRSTLYSSIHASTERYQFRSFK